MKLQRPVAFATIVVASIGLTLLAERFGWLTGVEALRQLALDFRQRSTVEDLRQGIAEEPSDIVIVFFDEDAVSEWPYLSPFPRDHLAAVVEGLSSAGARTIGLDVFLEDRYPELGGDERLRRAIDAAGNVVLVGATLATDSGPRLVEPDPYFTDVAADVGAADLPNPFETARQAALAVRSGNGLEPGFALALYAHARGVDVDSLLRESRADGRIGLPGMPAALGEIPGTWWEEDTPDQDFAVTVPIRYVGPGSHLAATDVDRVGTFTAVSSSTVPFLATLQPELFRDRIVLMGSGFHDSDKFRTPLSGYEEAVVSLDPDATDPGSAGAGVPTLDGDGARDFYEWTFGVEVHANLLQNMLSGEYVRPLGARTRALVLLLVALVAAGATFWKGAAAGAAGALAASGLAVALGFSAWSGELSLGFGPAISLDHRFLVTPVVPAIVTGFLSYLGSVGWVSVVEGREKRFIKGAFGKYVSPAVVDRIADDPEALRLGGQKRPLSILFSDLAGFTTLSERLDAEELITLLNEYLTEMTRLVMDEEGTLDKYIGDAIMAFWNAPTALDDHADRALRCAIRMQRKMDELNERWLADDPDAEPLIVRIGVNTGEVVVGNVGGENRFDYSAIGDAVNLAARLEPANKSYDTLVMASSFTVEAARADDFRLRELDLIAVKGKSEPVTVYEVVEEAGVEVEPHREAALAHYASGLRAYKNRDWSLAATYFEAALEEDPDDGPSRVYLERSRECEADPPPADWDFVVHRKVK